MNDLTTEENASERPSTPDGSRKQFRPLRAWPAFLLALLMLAARFGPGISEEGAELNRPHGVTVHRDGTLYIADSDNDRILKITR